MMHEEIKYNPLQQETYKYLNDDKNLVVLAPTSSGKTIVAEQFLFSTIEKGQKGVYLSPLKSLTEEKKRAWSDLPYQMLVITSDYGQPTTFKEPLILMTTEALDSKTRGSKKWINKVGTLVVDEAHLLGSEGRGDALEIGLMRFAKLNPNARIILLSATIPNAKYFGEWLKRLNKKETKVLESSWRPVKLSHNLVISDNEEWNLNKKVVTTVEKLTKKYPNSQILTFVHAIGKGHNLSKALQCPFHYSKLSREKKQNLEDAFEQKKIARLVSTSTLAWGRNLPADIVVIAGGERGPNEVWPIDIQQMAGRAGRFGMSTEGHVYYVFKRYHANEFYEKVTNIPPVDSVLDLRLYFHIVSFIHREGMQVEEIQDFLSRSFYGEIDIKPHIKRLMEYEILSWKNDEITVNNVGKASSMMYIDPFDLYFLKYNLQEKPLTPRELAFAFANIPSYAVPCYMPKDIEERPLEMPYAKQTIIATSLLQWLSSEELSPTAQVTVPPMIADIERWLTGLVIAGLSKSYVEAIKHMLVNGVSENLIELVQLQGVGRKRALKLYNAGIKTKDDIPKNKKLAQSIMTRPVYNRFMDELESPGKVILRF